MGNILLSVVGLVLFHNSSINPCTLSVEDVFPLQVYPFHPFFPRTDTEFLPFCLDFAPSFFFQDFFAKPIAIPAKIGYTIDSV